MNEPLCNEHGEPLLRYESSGKISTEHDGQTEKENFVCQQHNISRFLLFFKANMPDEWLSTSSTVCAGVGNHVVIRMRYEFLGIHRVLTAHSFYLLTICHSDGDAGYFFHENRITTKVSFQKTMLTKEQCLEGSLLFKSYLPVKVVHLCTSVGSTYHPIVWFMQSIPNNTLGSFLVIQTPSERCSIFTGYEASPDGRADLLWKTEDKQLNWGICGMFNNVNSNVPVLITMPVNVHDHESYVVVTDAYSLAEVEKISFNARGLRYILHAFASQLGQFYASNPHDHYESAVILFRHTKTEHPKDQSTVLPAIHLKSHFDVFPYDGRRLERLVEVVEINLRFKTVEAEKTVTVSVMPVVDSRELIANHLTNDFAVFNVMKCNESLLIRSLRVLPQSMHGFVSHITSKDTICTTPLAYFDLDIGEFKPPGGVTNLQKWLTTEPLPHRGSLIPTLAIPSSNFVFYVLPEINKSIVFFSSFFDEQDSKPACSI